MENPSAPPEAASPTPPAPTSAAPTSAAPISPAPAPPAPLTVVERRVLGVLVEKAKTTPDAYPLSLNGLTVGSNQKSNREPVMNLNDEQIETALADLQQRGLVTKITGSRVDRWRHNLYEHWQVDKVELAILTELLLRGPQTEGELRGRASRMEPIDDLETLRQKLRPMAERKLIVFLGPEGRRGTQIMHGFGAPADFEKMTSAAPTEHGDAPGAAHATGGTSASGEEAALRSALDSLKDQVVHLQTALQQVQEEMRALRASLSSNHGTHQ
jgi:uncharacterized protein YceH (UPF0502 family)